MRFTAFLLLFPFAVMAESGLPDRPFVSAEGVGKISVKPDGVRVMVAAIGLSETASSAFQESDEIVSRAVKAVKDVGLPEEAITASDISVGQDIQRVDGRIVSVGYEARRSVTIEVRDLEKMSALLDALLKQNVSEISHIKRFIDDEKEILARVRRMAMEDARKRAEAYAGLEERELGEVWWIGDDVSLTRQLSFETHLPGSHFMAQGSSPFFSAGDVELSQTVQVIYLLD